MCTVPVQITSTNTSKKVHTYALLDSCSHGTFILDQLANDLGISGRKTSLTMKTLNGKFTSNSTSIKRSQSCKHQCYLPVDNDITKSSQLRKWKYLENVTDQLTFSFV